MKRVAASILILCMPFMCSCSLFATSTQPITIIPSHENAEVYVDGNLKGKGVQTVFLHKRRSHSIMAKCGGSAGTGSVTRHLSTTGILDIIGGVLFLAPLLGLIAPGAWELSPTTISVPIPNASACEPDTQSLEELP